MTDNDIPTGRELDAAVAEICGWKWRVMLRIKAGQEVWLRVLISPAVDLSHGDFRPSNGNEELHPYWDEDVPAYSTDLNVAVTLGTEAERLGIAKEYLALLLENIEYNFNSTVASFWCNWAYSLTHASAEARAKAFYRAAKERQE